MPAPTESASAVSGGPPGRIGPGAALLDVPAVSADAWAQSRPLIRWLLASRAAVLALTLFACLFGGLLALPWDWAAALRWLLVTVALLLAHATNNLLNDHVDFRLGVDRDNYFRARYGAHPLAQGFIDLAAHRRLLIGTGTAALLLGLLVCFLQGGATWWFAAGGAVLLLFYTWPLKHFALGEIAVLLTWGPLMVGGVFWVVAETWRAEVLGLALLFGLGPTVVIFAKHTDKRDDDQQRRIHTLPVLLNAQVARWSWAALALLQVVVAVWLAVVLERYGLLLMLGAVPAAWRACRLARRERPAECPAGYPAHLWPLWYTVAAFRFTRISGLLLTVGVLLDGLLAG